MTLLMDVNIKLNNIKNMEIKLLILLNFNV